MATRTTRRPRSSSPDDLQAPALLLPPPEPGAMASLEAEQSVLGSLIAYDNALGEIRSLLPDASYFYFRDHQQIYDCLLALAEQGVTANAVTLPEEMIERHNRDKQEASELILVLLDMVMPRDMLGFHAQIIRDLSDRRASYSALRQTLNRVAHRGSDFRGAIAEAWTTLSRTCTPPTADSPQHQQLMQVLDEIEALWKHGRQITGLPLRIQALDRLTHGFQPGHLVVIAARPSVGKTQMLLHIARCAARMDPPMPGLLDSLEMVRKELLRRLIQSEAGHNVWAAMNEQDAPEATKKYLDAASRIDQWPLTVIEDAYTVPELRMRAELWRREIPSGPAWIGVDYLSHLRLNYGKNEAGRRDVLIGEQITRPLKAMARDLDCTVFLLAQISRAGAKGGAARGQRRDGAPFPRPTLIDLKDSGDIEQDADQVLFVHPLGPNGEHASDGHIELGLAKNRHGQAGWIDAAFNGQLGRYGEWRG